MTVDVQLSSSGPSPENEPVVPTKTILLPRALPHQVEVLGDTSRFKVVTAGRRWGKTVVGLISVIEGHGPEREMIGALQGGNIWWVCPTYVIATQIWRDLKRSLADVMTYKSEVEKRIELPGGGAITVRSTDNPDSLRGSGLDGLVIDEAAMVKESAWTEALRPALSDRLGWCIFISTPKGRNWFWRAFERAADRPNWKRWQRPTAENPKILPEEIEEARSELSPLVFAQEYEAQFITPTSGQIQPEWFKYYDVNEFGSTFYNLVTENEDSTKPAEIKSWSTEDLFRFQTVDLATSSKQTADFTVISTWGLTPDNELILLDCFRKRLEGPDHIPYLRQAYAAWHPAFIAMETTGMQLSIVQSAIAEGLPIKPVPADKDKVARAQNVMALMSHGKVYFRRDADYLDAITAEMLDFPDSASHDDFVDTLAYAGILVAMRPTKKLLFPKADRLISIFNLPSVVSGEEGTLDQSAFSFIAAREGTNAVDTKGLGPDWMCAYGDELESILGAIDPSFTSNADIPWHVHLSVSTGAQSAAIALSRISSWELRVRTVEGAPFETEVPIFEVPLILRIIPAKGSTQIDIGAVSDFVIALRQIRRFLVTSSSISGFHATSIAQKLTRAGIISTGGHWDMKTGLVEATGQDVKVDRQAYTDLQLAVNDKRIKMMKSGWALYELLQLEDEGNNKVVGIKETADAVAGAVGFIARFGHYVLALPNSDYITYDDLLPVEDRGGYDLGFGYGVQVTDLGYYNL